MVVAYPLLASFIAVALIPFVNHVYLWIRKFHRDRDANIEIQEIQKEIEVIKEKQDLKKEEKKLEKSEEEKWNEEYELLVEKYPNFIKNLDFAIYKTAGRIEDAETAKISEIYGLTIIKPHQNNVNLLIHYLTEK